MGATPTRSQKPRAKVLLKEMKYQAQYREGDYSRSFIFICLVFTCLLICLPMTRSYYVAEAGLGRAKELGNPQTFFCALQHWGHKYAPPHLYSSLQTHLP